jgi:hypothetical protein
MNSTNFKLISSEVRMKKVIYKKNFFRAILNQSVTYWGPHICFFLFCTSFMFLQEKSYAQFYMSDNSVVTMKTGAIVYINTDFETAGGTVNLNNDGDLRLTGNFINNATGLIQSNSLVAPSPLGTPPTTGTVHFQGTSQQSISGNDVNGLGAFVNLEINNQNATPLVYQNGVNISVDGVLTFTSGRLRTDATAVSDGSATKEIHITNPSTSAIVGASNTPGATTGFIEGRLRWTINSGSTYIFPIGSMKNAAPSGAAHFGEQFTQITNSVSGDVSASFTELYGPNALGGLHDCIGHISATGTPVTCMIQHGHWNIISPTASSMSINLKEAGGSECQAGTKDHTYVASTNSGSTWALNGNNTYCFSGANPGTPIGGMLERILVSGTGNWLAEGSSVTPILPIQLIDFTARPYENVQQSLLSWSTATEQNSKEFDIEWSLNGINWQTIGTEEAAGNSATEKDYSFIHTFPATGINYYQLKEVDEDGNATFSDVREVTFMGNGRIAISPNPAASIVNIRCTYSNPNLPFEVINVLGQRIAAGTLNSGNLNMDLKSWTDGMYYFRFYVGGSLQVIPVIKQN